jgi:DNA-binding transcriptional ArsR family regulator
MIHPESRARRIFACLGDPSRFQLIAELAIRERCVTDLAREVGLSQSCTTRHLQTLQKEGLVSGARNGKKVLFRLRLEEPLVARLVGWVIDHPHALDHVHGPPGSEPADSVVAPADRTPEVADSGAGEAARSARPPRFDERDEAPARPRIERRPIEDFLL